MEVCGVNSQSDTVSTEGVVDTNKTDSEGAPVKTGSATPPAVKPAAAVPAKPAPKAVRPAGAVIETVPDAPVNKMRRRIVWASITGALITFFLMFLRFFLPREIFEPSSKFRIGFPTDFAMGIDTKFQQQYRIWVNKSTDRIFVIYARCTHLGCTPDWKPSENKFKCPWHGSGYDSDAINFEGPAPRPMDRAHVELDAEGQIVVDINRLYKWEKGAPPPGQFNDDGAYIPV
jgi:cytochrome b6-f complex iron-sulfur subunit